MLDAIFDIGTKRYFQKVAYSGMSWSTNPGGNPDADPTTYPTQNPVMARSQRTIEPVGAVGSEREVTQNANQDLVKGTP